MAVSQIQGNGPDAPFFTIGGRSKYETVNNGSMITANDKLIGMLTNVTGISNNYDNTRNPLFFSTHSKSRKSPLHTILFTKIAASGG